MELPVLFERRGRIALFTINRPDQRNAVDPEVTRLMNGHVAEFERDPDLWVGIVTGAGEVAFSAGADLKAVAEGRMAEIKDADPYGFGGLMRGERAKPMIAAVNGVALAGGLEMAIACDIVVAAETARFGIPEVTRGIIAGAGGLQRLPLLIPPLRAMEMILTGQPIEAAEAHRLGLVNYVVPQAQVLARATEIAETIVANAPVAVQESRAVARTSIAAGEAAAWGRTDRAWERVRASPDALEGPTAFAERRPPVWVGDADPGAVGNEHDEPKEAR
jgi:enoyl-CoA hydratase/carnithine racemase